MRTRTGVITLCALVAFAFSSCAFFRKSETRKFRSDDVLAQYGNLPSFGITKDPFDEFPILKVRKLLNEGQWVDALLEARKILAAKPKDRDAIHALAVAYIGLDNTRSAMVEFDRLMQLYPDFDAAVYSLDELARMVFEKAVKNGRYDDCVYSFEKCRDAVKTEKAKEMLETWINSAYFGFGRKAYEKKDFEKAKKFLAKAVQQCPSNTPLWRKLGISYLRTEEYSEAVPVFEHAVKEEENPLDKALLFYARGFSEWERDKRAELLEKAIEAWPDGELDLLESAADSLIDFYRKKRQKKKMMALLNGNTPKPDAPDLGKCTTIHAAMFIDASRFPLYPDMPDEFYIFYFTQLYNYFKENKDPIHASRALYGRFLFDKDWEKFKADYEGVRKKEFLPAEKVRRVLGSFFVVEKK